MAENGKSLLDIATIIAAWWGAAIATGVLLWDVLKWRWSGPGIHVHAQGGMVMVGPGLPPDEKRYIGVTIENRGRAPTTVRRLGTATYSNINDRKRKKPQKNFIVLLPAYSEQLPKLLEPGEVWIGSFQQNEEMTECGSNGIVELLVSVSHADEPVRTVIKFLADTSKET